MELLIGFVFLGASLAVAFVLPILSFLRSTRALRHAESLARDVQALRAEVAALRAGTTTPPTAVGPGGPTLPAATTATAPADIPPVPVPTTTVGPGGPTLPTDTATAADDAFAEAATDSVTEYAAVVDTEGPDGPPMTVGPGGPTLPPTATAAVATGSPMDGLEERIGARWLLYAGIGSLILGISYFVKFAFDNGWVSEPLRVAVGLVAGGVLIGAGQRFVQRGLGFFGHTLSGGGLVVLYVAIYAALHVYELIGPSTAFTAMVAVTLLGLWLADRHRVQVLGALALLGGFLTPALVGGREDRQIVLFLYNALLLTGALAMVARYTWAGVAVLAYGCSVLLSVAWAAAHYQPDAGLRTLLLITVHLVLLACMVVALRRQRAASTLALPASWVLLTAPLLYHAAALWLIGRSQGLFLVYLLVATVVGLSVSYHAGWRWARTILLALVAIPFIDWMGNLIAPRWYAAAFVAAIALYLLHLAGQWRDLSDDDPDVPVPVAEFVHTHATGVFLPVALYAFLDHHAAWWNAPMLAAIAGWNLGVASVVRARMPILAWQFVALGATIGAVAISEWFDGPVVAIGWALEGVAVGYAALRSGNRWLEGGALALLGLSALRLLEALGASMPVGTWPIVNTRTLATVVVVGAMAWLAARVRDLPTLFGGPWARHTLIVVANVLAIAWLSAEIVHVFAERALAASTADLPSGAARAELGQQVALSVAWALYAVGLVAAGFRSGYAPARYLAIALFGITIVKVMTKDVAELDRVYQMLSVLGVGVLLVSASYLYQRMTRTPDV